jgi:tetratricopeptide (TPR) repeat protein
MGNTLIDDLKNQIAGGRCIVIVGAGVSVSTTGNAPCASWTGLLRHGTERCAEVVPGLPAGWGERVAAEIDSGDLDDLLSAAEKVASKLRAPEGGEYARWLRESVGALPASHKQVLEALTNLGVVLATTNYDNLIEHVTGLPPVTWMDGSRVERVLRGDERAVLHLHGHWQQPRSVVLGIRSYDQILGSEHAQATLRAMAVMRTIVFVGCGDGLKDPNFGALLQWTGKVFSGSEYRRFLLARQAEVARLQQDHPAEERLFVIEYGAGFDDLAPFLRALGRPAPRADPQMAGGNGGAAGFAPLPPRPRCFGREEEMADLVAALLAPQPEPIPILGPPGIGKTNLALSAAHDARIVARYGTRRVLLRCDGSHSRADLAATLVGALGLTAGKDNESAALAELARAPVLLIVDDAEAPWEGDTLGVEELLGRMAGVPGLALVLTLRGNQRPAGVPWREAFRPLPLAPDAARGLFLSLAGRQFGGDPRLDGLLSAVDYVPLAITLVATLAEGEPDLESIWARWLLERSAMLQRAGGRDRLTNMELSYELSWSGPRMTEAGRRFMRLLVLMPVGLAHRDLAAVFPGAEAASAVLRKCGLAFDEVHRVRVLAPLREYVRRRYPPAPGDLEPLAAHFIALADSESRRLGLALGGVAATRLAAEAPNIEFVLLNALADDSAAAIAAAVSWAKFMRFTGMGSTVPIESAAEAARRIGDLRAEAQCIKSLGDIGLARSDNERAGKRYEQALQLYRNGGDASGEASCIKGLAETALASLKLDSATEWYEQALLLFRRLGDIPGAGNCIKGLGNIALRRSDHQGARVLFEEALPLYRRAGEVLGEANCIKSLGDIALAVSDYQKAHERYAEALPLYREAGDALGEANCDYRLGEIALARSDHPSARKQYEKALPRYRQVGVVVGEANCVYRLGELALAEANIDGARSCYERAMPLYRQLGNVLGEGNCHFGLARCALLSGADGAAVSGFAAALGLFERFRHPYPIGAAHFLWSKVCQGLERDLHREAARKAWRGMAPVALAALAVTDGITQADLGALWAQSATSIE